MVYILAGMDLVINTYGTRIRSSGERIILVFPTTRQKKEYSIHRLDKVIILRPSSISTGAVQLALEHDVDIVYLGSFGKPVGRIFPSHPRGLTKLRPAQLETAGSPKTFELAKAFVTGKVHNQIQYLEHLQAEHAKTFQKQILQAQTMASSIDMIPTTKEGIGQLLGIEGYVADKYFACLKKLYRFPGRDPKS